MEHLRHQPFPDPLAAERPLRGNAGAARRTAWQTTRVLLPFLWPEDHYTMRCRVLIAIACLLAGRSANVYGPILLKDLIDGLNSLIPGADTGAAVASAGVAGLIGLALLYGVTLLLPGAMTEIRVAVFTPVSEFAQKIIGLKTFRHLHHLSMRFHLERRTGGLSNAIERGTRALQQIIGLFAFNIAPTLFEIGMVCAYLAISYPGKYVLVILLALAGYIAFTLLFTEWRTHFRREMVAQESRAMAIGVDSLLNFETVKYFGNENWEASRYDHALSRYMAAAVKSQNTLGMLNGGQLVARALCQMVILILAVQDYAAGSLTMGEVVMLNTFMLQLFIPLGFLGSSYRMIRQSLVDMEFMFQLLDLAPEIKDAPDAPELHVDQGRVSFQQVYFCYDPQDYGTQDYDTQDKQQRDILKGVSFTIEHGKTLAVVGPSGAGKSTLARLMYRFYDVQQGQILIDGQDISQVTQTSLREAVGIVPQDTVLFNDTIRYNIRYGKPDASDAEVEAAARHASIHDFITSLPLGYDARVGERGLKLSGGEKQRVAIARTVLKNPKILVLDEATSALDIKTEREIQGALMEIAKHRTSLVIAHRLSTIVNADEILVLDKGEIVERGTHTSLVQKQGVYADMWRRQKEAADRIEELQDIVGEDELHTLQIDTD